MAYAEKIFRTNFLEYASYVIKDRAIPDVEDGFKPVQRRIIHSLLEMDDGKFHKVANVVGHCMKYHPHGDSSIYGALVNLANFDLFIEKQGNFGNELTGDNASAARYIECRILPFAKKVLYHPSLVPMCESYDGRNKEPIVFPAKIPVVLMQGTEGIAVGMSTTILRHNPLEVVDAVIKALENKSFQLYPDFKTGAILDVSDYQDGLGSVLIRAKLNTKDEKKIIIEELPATVTTEKMIESIDKAASKGKLKISSINDFTTDKVNIEITLARGTYSKDVVDALYAFTDCEKKISCNSLVINNRYPKVMTITDIIHYHKDHLLGVLKNELEFEKNSLFDKLHARTLERIFVEDRIYKRIEQKRTSEAVVKAVLSGFEPYKDELLREVTEEDVERLLKIPIRRISLFDIEKNKKEIDEINNRIKEIDHHLNNLVSYAIGFLTDIRKDMQKIGFERKSKISTFEEIKVKEAVNRDLSLKYDNSTGMLGYEVKTGVEVLKVSEYDRILIVCKDGTYFIKDVPDKLHVGKGMQYCGFNDKDELDNITFTAIFVEKASKYLFIKRCKLNQFILDKSYSILPDPSEYKLVKLSTFEEAELSLKYKIKKGQRVNEETRYFSEYRVKGVKANGVRITMKELDGLKLKEIKGVVKSKKKDSEDDQPSLF